MGPPSLEPQTLQLLGKGSAVVVCESCLGSQLSGTKGLRWGLHPTTAEAWISMPQELKPRPPLRLARTWNLLFVCVMNSLDAREKKLILLIPPSGH